MLGVSEKIMVNLRHWRSEPHAHRQPYQGAPALVLANALQCSLSACIEYQRALEQRRVPTREANDIAIVDVVALRARV